MSERPINVTQPSLPPLRELVPLLKAIWESRTLTNNGHFHRELEHALCDYLGVREISLFCNATIALITALKALDIKGEVITTPYSFVATAHSLLWNGIKPVFIDIDPVTLNLDPCKIKAAITPSTSAILPVHVYGRPCDVDSIDSIAKEHDLKVIYDAAHAFGVQCHCGSVLNHGDLSVLSFHATKVFNTFEGGAIVSNGPEMKCYIDQLKNFGFTGETTVVQTGINGKMNEFSAALGLLQLQNIDNEIKERKVIDQAYRQALKDIPGIRCHFQSESGDGNYGYFPIFVDANYPLNRDELYERLRASGIRGRRYFYPLITEFPMYRNITMPADFPIAKSVSESVICLPIYPGLPSEQIQKVADRIASV